MLTKDEFIKDFKKALIDSNSNMSQLAKQLNKTQGTISQQVNGATFRYVDLVNILDMLGYDVVWVKRKNNESK